MKKILQPAFDFLLFGNIFMAVCAAVQGLVTFYLIHTKPIVPVIYLLFTSTLGIYNFSIIITRPKQPELSGYKRVRWFFAHYRLMVTITIICLLSLAPLFFLMSMEARILLIFLSIISFSYSLPLFTVAGHKFGLRNIPGLKQVLITLVWTMSTVLLPILEAQHFNSNQITLRNTTILIAERFLFIGALTIPFDIRDLFDDRKTGLKTIPTVFGENNAYLACQILLAGSLILLIVFRPGGFNSEFWALAINVMLAAWLVLKSKWEKNEYYYFFYVDGVLILQYLLLVLFNFLSRSSYL